MTLGQYLIKQLLRTLRLLMPSLSIDTESLDPQQRNYYKRDA
jgi:hypothetical protein